MGNGADHVDGRDSQQVYDKAANDFRAKAPELLTYKYIVRPAIQRALAEFSPSNRETLSVLDVGSASGRNVHTLIDNGFAPRNIFGVEISPEQVQIARREIPDATFEVGDISTYHLKTNSYDLAIMVMVAEFLDKNKYPRALDNIHRSMRNGGLFIYITTDPDRYKAKYGVSQGEVTTKGPWSDDLFINYVRSKDEQVAAINRAGFKVETAEELDIPVEVEEADRERRSKFEYPDQHVRLVITARKL